MDPLSIVEGPAGRSAKTHPELQRARRYPVSAPVSFWWNGADGTLRSAIGVTSNVSTSGSLIVASSCPPVGIAIALEIDLPPLLGRRSGVRLYGEGSVARGPNQADCVQDVEFAVQAQFYPQRPDRGEEQAGTQGQAKQSVRKCAPD